MFKRPDSFVYFHLKRLKSKSELAWYRLPSHAHSRKSLKNRIYLQFEHVWNEWFRKKDFELVLDTIKMNRIHHTYNYNTANSKIIWSELYLFFTFCTKNGLRVIDFKVVVLRFATSCEHNVSRVFLTMLIQCQTWLDSHFKLIVYSCVFTRDHVWYR